MHPPYFLASTRLSASYCHHGNSSSSWTDGTLSRAVHRSCPAGNQLAGCTSFCKMKSKLCPAEACWFWGCSVSQIILGSNSCLQKSNIVTELGLFLCLRPLQRSFAFSVKNLAPVSSPDDFLVEQLPSTFFFFLFRMRQDETPQASKHQWQFRQWE